MSQETTLDGARVSVRVPAKVNLFLAVRGVRDDGYHELTTVLQTVSIFDELRVAVTGPPGQGHHPAARRRMRLVLRHGGQAGLPDGEANLAVRAGLLLGRAAGVLDGVAETAPAGPTTLLELAKAIPIAGGMAGGSADAAAALVALNELWRCELPRQRLRELAGELGSDVPFCVTGGTALASGRGTALAQVLCKGRFHWVVVPDAVPLRTGDVYRAWDERCEASEIEPDAVLQALRSADAVALGAALHNDLEPAAFALRPELADRKDRLMAAGALGAVLSGSGPTMLALVADKSHARAVADVVTPALGAPILATSPAGGPEVRASATPPRSRDPERPLQ